LYIDKKQQEPSVEGTDGTLDPGKATHSVLITKVTGSRNNIFAKIKHIHEL